MSQGELFQRPDPLKSPQRGRRSASQLSLYFSCGEAFRRRYIEKEVVPAGIGALIGTGMHAAAEHNFRQKIESHADLPEQEVIEAAIAGFEKRLASDGVTLTPEEELRGRAVVLDAAKDKVAQFAAAFMVYQAADYQPKAVEKYIVIPVPRGPSDIVGYLDLVTVDHDVLDFKTGKRAKSSHSAAESTQLTLYAAGHKVAFGTPARKVGLDILIETTKGVRRQVLMDTRDHKDFVVLANRLNTMEKGVQAGVFLPANVGDWKCSNKWCEYFTTCPYVNAERIAAAQKVDAENE
jgi:hypothetical protein